MHALPDREVQSKISGLELRCWPRRGLGRQNCMLHSSERRNAVEMTLFDASFDVKALAVEQMLALAVSCAESEFPVRRRGAYVRPLPDESDARCSRDGDVGARSVDAWRADGCEVARGGRGGGG